MTAVGVVNTAVTFAVFNLLATWLGAPAAAANLAGWTAGFVNSYFLNRAWTFADRRGLQTGRVLARFALTNALAFGISELVVITGDALLTSSGLAGSAPRALALNAVELAAITASLSVNYLLSQHWAFRVRQV